MNKHFCKQKKIRVVFPRFTPSESWIEKGRDASKLFFKNYSIEILRTSVLLVDWLCIDFRPIRECLNYIGTSPLQNKDLKCISIIFFSGVPTVSSFEPVKHRCQQMTCLSLPGRSNGFSYIVNSCARLQVENVKCFRLKI